VLERWTRAVLRFRRAVLLAWLTVVAAGLVAAVRLPPHLSNSFAVPGTESDRARSLLQREFGERPDGTFLVVERRSRAGSLRGFRSRLDAAAHVLPTGRVGEVREVGGVRFGELRTTLDLARAKRWTQAVRAALARSGPGALVTGQPAIQHDLDPVVARDLERGEAVALPLALVALVALFGVSLAVAVPFVFALCTITATLAVLYALSSVVAMTSFVTNVVELIGLGLAVDYSLAAARAAPRTRNVRMRFSPCPSGAATSSASRRT
jgi:RND superfamily putative drug exporter